MKKITSFLSIAILAIINVNNLEAQNDHSVYFYPQAACGAMQSMVNMSSTTTGDTWMVMTSSSNDVVVARMNSNYPTPRPISTTIFQLNIPTLSPRVGQILLKNGFFDPNGNIFVYGYEESASLRGVYIQIIFSSGFNGVPISIKCGVLNDQNSQISDGCWARHYTSGQLPPNNINYGIIYGNKFARILGSTFGIDATKEIANGGKITSVNYDDSPTVNTFVLSGNTSNTTQFIGTLANNSTLGTITSRLLTLATANLTFSQRSNRHVLSGNGYFYDGYAYLVQDLSFGNAFPGGYSDGIWVTKINYINGTIGFSRIYKFPPEKAWITGLAHDFKYIFVLGHHNWIDNLGNTNERRYIAQIDIFTPTNYKVKSMNINLRDFMPLPYSSYYTTDQAYLTSLNFNNLNFSPYTTGVINGLGYLVETFDLNYDNCDINRPVTSPAFSYSQSTANLGANSVYFSPTVTSGYSPNSLPPGLAALICGDPCYWNSSQPKEMKPNIEDIISQNIEENSENSTKSSVLDFTDQPQVEVIENQFVCKGFIGKCEYKITDVLGTIVQEGNTYNFEINDVNITTSGIYFITVTDENNNIINEKFVIVE